MEGLLKTIIDFLKSLFKKSEPLKIPHPEEPVNPAATMDNVNITSVLTQWKTEWFVADGDYFNSVEVVLSEKYSVPALTYAIMKKMYVRPEWANPGVIAHEMAHVSYPLIPEEQQEDFITDYESARLTDPLLKLLYSRNAYMRTSYTEAHADIYRYLGDKMPEVLKGYYPKLL